MNTWTCKGPLAGLALLALAGCTEDGGLALDAPSAGKAGTGSAVVIGGGRVAVSAPSGFCIDPDSVTQSGRESFAMLARCANLSPQSALVALSSQGPAVMTVTTKPWGLDDTPITADTIAAAYPAGAVAEKRTGTPPMVRAVGSPPSSGLAEAHWRGAFVVNDQLVVLGLFAPEGSRALGATGANLLTQLARRTTSASRSLAAPVAAPVAGKATN